MKRETAESSGLALAGAVVAGQAGHWFITPIRHPGASTLKAVLVGLQLVLGLAVIWYAVRVQRRERKEETPHQPVA